jgi:uncharacterized repeat protein (TIGR01451 family)
MFRIGEDTFMNPYLRIFSGVVLLSLLFSAGIVCAAEGDADLNVTKVVSSAGPFRPGDNITWKITLWNNGPQNATNISLAEDISALSGLVTIAGVADQGVYNNTTRIWNITELKNATFTTLTVVTGFNTQGEKKNAIEIRRLDQTDPVSGNNHAEAKVLINKTRVIPDIPVSVNLTIRPTTLNLKSRGVFTVFITLSGGNTLFPYDSPEKSRIDYANSSLTCSGAEMIRAAMSDKKGGTLTARFHRQDLENVTSGNGITINCSGTLLVNGTSYAVEGSDTIRVIGEKKGLDKVLSQLWKFLGVEKDDVLITEGEDGNVTVTLSLDPDNFKNEDRIKKMLKIRDNKPDPESINETGVSDKTRNGEMNQAKNNGDAQRIREKKADNKPDKYNNGNNKHNDDSPGKPDGKKNI